MVFEYFNWVLEFAELSRKQNIKINIVIDEAQELLNARNYRKSVIEITDSIEKLLELNANVILLSGTTEGIRELFPFDYIIDFEKEEKELTATNLNIYDYDKSISTYTFNDYILNILKQGTKNNIVHINSIKKIEQFNKALEKDFKTNVLTSKDKNYSL